MNSSPLVIQIGQLWGSPAPSRSCLNHSLQVGLHKHDLGSVSVKHLWSVLEAELTLD